QETGSGYGLRYRQAALSEEVDTKYGKVCWWKTLRGRPTATGKDHMIYHMLFSSFSQNQKDLPRDIPPDSVEVLRRRITDLCIRDQALRFTCCKYIPSHEDPSTDLESSSPSSSLILLYHYSIENTILFGLPEDIYAAVDSCETAQEIWLRVQQMMKGSDIEIQEKKAKLFNKWEMFTFNEGESIESYYHRFLKLMNDLKRN
nr:hypothetical protein [Tanacetum cinerariifolium]